MIRLALERGVSTAVAVVMLVTLGVFSLAHLPVALLPTLERPRLVVTATAEGRSRLEVQEGLTIPLERRLSGLPGLTSLRSLVEDGWTRLVLETDWNEDADRLRIDAARLIDGAGSIRPDTLQVEVSGGDATPILEIAVVGGAGEASRTELAEEVLRPEMALLAGAGHVDLVGRRPERIVVRPRAAALAARSLDGAAVPGRLVDVGRLSSAGAALDGGVRRPLVIAERVRSEEELRRVIVGDAGSSVPLGDVASVSVEPVPDGTACRVDGEDAVLVRLWRAPGANAVTLAREAAVRLAALTASRADGLDAVIVVDRSREVVSALSTLGWAAFLGVLLGTFVLRLMLGRWTATLALAVVMPASILTAFCAFHAFGVPLDVVSLAGLALAAGMLVDNAIVVLESIESARSAGVAAPRLSGTRQVAGAVVASSLTTMVVFVPLVYLRGLARAFFGEQAFAVAASVGASLLFSLTLTPLLAGRSRARAEGWSPGRAGFERLLAAALDRPGVTVLAALVLVLAAGSTVLRLPRELLPERDVDALRVEYVLPEGLAAAEATRRDGEVADEVLSALGDVRPARWWSVRGLRELEARAGGGETAVRGRMELEFEGTGQAGEALRRLRATTAAGGGWRVDARPNAFVEAVQQPGVGLEVVVTARREAALRALVPRVAEALERWTGARPVPRMSGGRRPVMRVDWDRERLVRLGVGPTELERRLRESLSPSDAGRAEWAGRDLGIHVAATQSPSLAAHPLLVPDPARGSPRAVPLGALARLERGEQEARVEREDGRPARRLGLPATARVADPSALARRLRTLCRSPDESVRLGGEALEMARSFSELRWALGLAVLLAFLSLAASTESVVRPVVILTTVPVATAGGLLALWLLGGTVNLMSLLGLILLAGIVVNNAIVLLYRVDQRRADGQSARQAVLSAAHERYRPILMTTATTVFGMLPLAALAGDGAELRQALAVTVLGGLVTSTPAALLVVPVLSTLVERRRS